MASFQEIRIKDEAYMINLDGKKSKESIELNYLLTEIQLYTLILLEMNMFLQKCLTRSMINELLTMYLEYKIVILLCVDFIASVS